MGPILVLGTVRSGTTAVARMLGDHPSCEWLGFEESQIWQRWGGLHIGSPASGHGPCPSAPGSLPIRRRLALRVAVRMRARVRRRLVLKNPHLWNKVGAVASAYPSSCAVITVRSVRDTAASVKYLWQATYDRFEVAHHLPEDPQACWTMLPAAEARDGDPRTFPGGDITVLADYWLRTYSTLVSASSRFRSVAVVTPQDLTHERGAVQERLANTLRLSPSTWWSELDLQPRTGDLTDRRLSPRDEEALDAWLGANGARVAALGLPVDGR